MRSISPLTSLALLVMAISPQLAMAEVFKCTTADGKTSYSSAPCTAAGAKEVVVPIVAGNIGSSGEGRDWAAENAAINARTQAAEASRIEAAEQRMSAAGKTAGQITAECQANRGVDCANDKEIARRQADERTLTPDEAAALHRASAGRQANERAAAEAKAKADAKNNPPKPPPPAAPGKT